MNKLVYLRRVLLPLLAFVALSAEDVAPPAPDCTFQVEAMQPTGAALWHRLSMNAEAVAPTGTSSSNGRRRVVAPPSVPQQFTARNFIDTEIFGRMQRDKVRWADPSTDAEFL